MWWRGLVGLLWFSVIVVCFCFYVPWIVMRPLSVNCFQSSLFYILHGVRLSSTFLWTFFFNVVLVVLCCFFSQPDVVNITWITGHIDRTIVDIIDQTSEDVEMVKKIPYQIHVFMKCDQKNLFTVPSIDQ